MNSIVVSSTEAPKISISSPQVNTISITPPTQRIITGTINIGSAGTPGVGVIAGGTTGQSLVKASNIDYDTTWADRLESVEDDLSPVLGANLDVYTFSLFTSATNQDVMFTPNGTGSVNLNGTVKFKRFTSPPDPFEGGMYADDNDNLFFGVS